MARAKIRFEQEMRLPRRYNRKERTIRLQVRSRTVTLRLLNLLTKETTLFPVNVVDTLEVGPRPRGESAVHWRLFTNQPIKTKADVARILGSYKHRWKIEELHRTWKSGACRVERKSASVS